MVFEDIFIGKSNFIINYIGLSSRRRMELFKILKMVIQASI
jgi:hypothetical protein